MIDELHDAMKAAGWSVGVVQIATAGGESLWQVDASRGDHVVLAHGRTQAEACWQICLRHRSVRTSSDVRVATGPLHQRRVSWTAASAVARCFCFFRSRSFR